MTTEQPRWQPTAAERRKYADYTTEIVADSDYPCFIEVQAGMVVRFSGMYSRIPSRKVFRLRMKYDATEKERAIAKRVLELMPAGEWARIPDLWEKRRYGSDGRWCFSQTRGSFVDDPLVQLELEMMIDDAADVTTKHAIGDLR